MDRDRLQATRLSSAEAPIENSDSLREAVLHGQVHIAASRKSQQKQPREAHTAVKTTTPEDLTSARSPDECAELSLELAHVHVVEVGRHLEILFLQRR